MEKTNYTLRDLLRAISVLQDDRDVVVDGADFAIAVVGTDGIVMTPAALEHFKGALELPVEGNVIMGEDKDYDDYDNRTGRIFDAVELLRALAGYCSAENYEKWFEGSTAELI
jgi:hypothetical protein